MRAAFVLKDRSDRELLEGVWAAVTRECEDVAIVIAHLAEMETRKLFVEEGCGSLKGYCMEVLHLSEDQAYTRIGVARISRKFPIVLEMLAEGLVHLTAVYRLGQSLTAENHVAVLEEATYKSMAEVEEIVARLRPKPPVPTSIRKVKAVSEQEDDGLFESGSDAAALEVEAELAQPGIPAKSAVSPLAPDLYDIHFTADKETVDALKLLLELESHRVPSGDPAILIKEGLLLRLKQAQRQRFGKEKGRSACAEAPQLAQSPKPVSTEEAPVKGTMDERSASRHIPKEVKTIVWERDQGQCAYVARNGRRCSERKWIEYHHVIPFAWKGESTVENIQLRCRAHNAFEGELIFGMVGKSKRALPVVVGFQPVSRTAIPEPR